MALVFPARGLATFNTTLWMGSDFESPITYVMVAGCGDFTGPSKTVNTNDVSCHQPVGEPAYRRKVPGLIDPGTVSFPLFFTPDETTQNDIAGLEAVLNARELRSFKFVHGDGSEEYFNGYVTKLTEAMSVAGVYTRQCEITIDGEITWVYAA